MAAASFKPVKSGSGVKECRRSCFFLNCMTDQTHRLHPPLSVINTRASAVQGMTGRKRKGTLPFPPRLRLEMGAELVDGHAMAGSEGAATDPACSPQTAQ